MLISIFPILSNSQHFLPDTAAPVAGILATGEPQAGRGAVVVVVVVYREGTSFVPGGRCRKKLTEAITTLYVCISVCLCL